jgi:glucokinase
MKVLAGDLGGTKALLGIAEFDGMQPRFLLTRRYASADFSDCESLLAQFRQDAAAEFANIQAACLAVAGPIDDDGRQARFTNLPWHADAAVLANLWGTPVYLANDFAAVAAGVAVLADDQRLCLQAGSVQDHGVRLVIGAGTGLGMAVIVPHDSDFDILPSEGGHIGYAPADERQASFAAWLRQTHGRATAERAISGMGLVDLYRHLAEQGPADTPNPLATPEPGAAIGSLALATPTSLAHEAVRIFLSSYGAFAGDMALALLARGGVYLAGGVTQKLLPLVQSGDFLAAFNAKAEHAALAQRMPVHVVTDPDIGLRGAAVLAQRTSAPLINTH